MLGITRREESREASDLAMASMLIPVGVHRERRYGAIYLLKTKA